MAQRRIRKCLCGRKPEIRKREPSGAIVEYFQVFCPDCGRSGPILPKEDAVDAWNYESPHGEKGPFVVNYAREPVEV